MPARPNALTTVGLPGLRRRLADDRGDVPGWVLVTLMTAGLVIGLWTVADDALQNVFTQAMTRVLSN